MTDGLGLVLGFLEHDPGGAARVLEDRPAAHVAALLRRTAPVTAGRLLAHMVPRQAARVMEEFPPDQMAGYLRPLAADEAAAILGHLSAEARRPALSAMARGRARACRTLLRYRDDEVGAWMKVDVMSCPDDITAGEALRRLRREDGSVMSHIYVVFRDGRLRGAVEAGALLRADRKTPVLSLAAGARGALQARAPLTSVSGHQAWVLHDQLPVVDRRGRLMGVLRHVDLRRGLLRLQAGEAEEETTDVFLAITESYATGMSELLGMLLPGTARDRGARSGEHRHVR